MLSYACTSLISETIKLLGGIKERITKDLNGDNVPQLEITEVAVVHCYTVNNEC